MDNINRLSKYALVASDQAYNPKILQGNSLAPYEDSPLGSSDIYPNSMPATFIDPINVGLADWKVLTRIDSPTTGFGATVYTRLNDGKTDYLVALQGTRGLNPQDWGGNLIFALDKWTSADGGVELLNALTTELPNITGDIIFTGQSLGGALAEYAAYEFKNRHTEFSNSRIGLVTFNGLGSIAGLQKLFGAGLKPNLLTGSTTRHYWVVGDIVHRLAAGTGDLQGHVHLNDVGTEYRLDFLADGAIATGQLKWLGPVDAHRIESGFYAGLNLKEGFLFSNAVQADVRPIQVTDLARFGSGFGNLFNADNALTYGEATSRIIASLLYAFAFGQPGEIQELVSAFSESLFRSGKMTKKNYLTVKLKFPGILRDFALTGASQRVQIAALVMAQFLEKFETTDLVSEDMRGEWNRTVTVLGQEELFGTNPKAIASQIALSEFLVKMNGKPLDQFDFASIVAIRVLAGTLFDSETFPELASVINEHKTELLDVFYSEDEFIKKSAYKILIWYADKYGYGYQTVRQLSAWIKSLGEAISTSGSGYSKAYLESVRSQFDSTINDLARSLGNSYKDFVAKYEGGEFDVGELGPVAIVNLAKAVFDTFGNGLLKTSTLNLLNSFWSSSLGEAKAQESMQRLQESMSLITTAGQLIAIKPGHSTNPFSDEGFDPDDFEDTDIDERSGVFYTVYLPYAAANNQRIKLAIVGSEKNKFRVIAGDEVPVTNGEFELTVKEGQREVAFALIQNGDVDTDAALTLSATLVDANGQPTHQTHVELNLTLDAVVESDQAATTSNIIGDLAPIDFSPAPGVQTQTDALGNIITDPAQPQANRVDALFDSTANDRIIAGGGSDLVNAFRGGDDTIEAGAGTDVVQAGGGNDVAIGGGDADVLFGGAGDDELIGGETTTLDAAIASGETDTASGLKGDLLDGGADRDIGLGSVGNDYINGGEGQDTLVGGAGDDTIDGDDSVISATLEWSLTRTVEVEADGSEIYGLTLVNASPVEASLGGSDVIYGGAGADWIFAGSDDDFAEGGSGEDVLFGERGSDTLLGGDGNDVLVADNRNDAESLQGDDFLDGGAGNDSIYGNGGNDTLYGGSGDDRIEGDSLQITGGEDYLDGEGGNDTLIGAGGADTIYGGEGNDSIAGDSDNTPEAQQDDDELFGNEGNDHIQGYAGKDTIDGGSEDDILFGGKDDDEMFGDAGKDYLQGDEGADYLDGGEDTDTIHGNDGDDTIFGGAGDDKTALGGGLAGEAGNDFIDGEAGEDELLGGAGNDQLFGSDGADLLFGQEDDDTLDGGNGNDQLEGGLGTDILIGGDGDDELFDAGGNDTLTGGAGNDFLAGGLGKDTYVFNLGDGVDHIQDDSTGPEASVLVLGPGISSDMLSLGLGSLLLRVGDEGDAIHFENFNSSDPLNSLPFERLQFDDGTSLTYTEVLAQGFDLRGTDAAETLFGTVINDRISGLSGNDRLVGLAHDDTFDGGAGDDTLEGGAGNDSYFDGEGQDVVVDLDSAPGEIDVLALAGARDDYRVERDANNIYARLIGDATRTVILGNALQTRYRIEEIQFGDGSTWDFATALANSTEIAPPGGITSVYGTFGNDELLNTSGNNTVSGREGDDIYAGGAGNDTFVDVGGGNDRYRLSRGDGVDQIDDDAGINHIEFEANVKLTDISASHVQNVSGLFLVLNYGGQDSVTIKNGLRGGSVQSFTFPDSTVVMLSELLNQTLSNAVTLTSTALFSSLYGGRGNDTLRAGNGVATAFYGGQGGDSLIGNNADDLYYFERGDGNDFISDGATSFNTIVFGPGLSVSELRVTSVSGVLAIDYGPGDSIQISNALAGAIRRVRFDDAGTLEFDQLLALMPALTTGTAGDDVLTGTAGRDQLDALAGNDTLTGLDSNDNLNGGIGSDTLTGGAGNDKLDGGADVDSMAGGPGNDTYLVDNAADAVNESLGEGHDFVQSLASYTLGAEVEELLLLAGATGTGNALDNRIVGKTQTSVFNYLLKGLDGNDVLLSELGTDTLEGGTGADVLDAGAGNDTLDGGSGADQMRGGPGNDTYKVDHADDLVIEVAGAGTDILQTTVDYTLPAEVETLTLLGVAVSGTGNEGSNTIIGNASDNTLRGAEGNDLLTGNGGADRLAGGAGNDTLEGGTGNDTYVFNVGDGLDMVSESDATPGNTDTLELGVLRSQVLVRRDDFSLYLTIAPGDEVRLFGHFSSNAFRTEKIKFSNGEIIDTDLLPIDPITGSEGSDFIIGTKGADLINGLDGNDTLLGEGANDILNGGNGNDNLGGGPDNDTLNGNAGDDTLGGGSGIDTLNGGAGNDRLEGGFNTDFYDFAIGDGVDEIRDANFGEIAKEDTLRFGPGIKPEDILITRDGAQLEHLTLHINPFDSVRLVTLGFFAPSGAPYFAVDRILFETANWSQGNLLDEAINDAATEGDDVIVDFVGVRSTIHGLGGDDHLSGLSDSDELFGDDGNDTLSGGDGNDRLDGGAGDDLLDGNAGNDVMNGGPGDDVFISDSASDTLVETGGEGFDTLKTSISRFLPGFVERVILTGTASIDITGLAGDNEFVGNSGNNTFTDTTAGSETYHFGRGSGADRIVDFQQFAGEIDAVKIDPGVLPNELMVARSGNDMVLSIQGASDTLTLVNWFGSANSMIEEVRFADSPTVWNATILAQKASGTSNAPPVVSHAIADQTTNEDALLQFTLPADVFSDPDNGDTLTLSATRSDGTLLPGWLSFNSSTRVLSGTPVNADVGTLSVKVTAMDTGGLTAFDTFDLSVLNVNDAPVAIADSVAVNENATTANLVSAFLSNDTDVDALDTRSITAVNTTGTVGTVAFNLGAQTLTYAANGASLDALRAGVSANDTFTYTMKDAAGAASTATVTMTVTGVNDAPVAVGNSVAVNENATTATLVATLLSNDTDVDAGDTRSITAVNTTGTVGTVAFDALAQTLTYAANGAALDALRAGVTANDTFTYTATDSGGASSTATVSMTVTGVNDAPVLANSIADQTADANVPFAFTVAEDAFNDVDLHDTLSYSASLADDSLLPGWLHFDPATRILSGTPANGDAGVLSIKIKALDGGGLSASDVFDLSVNAAGNHAPTLEVPVADQITLEDAAFSFTLPTGMFADVDAGDSLTLSAKQADGSELPAWLTFDAVSKTLVGTPANADVNTIDIKITATDSGNAKASDTFSLTVINTNDAPVAVGDNAAVNENATTANLVATLLANDTDVDVGDTRSITEVNTTGTTGTVAFDAGAQTLTYAASGATLDALRAGVTANDTFTYTAKDAAGASSTATVTMTVTGVNDALVAVDDGVAVNENATTTNLVATLLANDTDIDVGDTRSITAINTTGTVAFDAVAQTLTYAANGAALDALRQGVTANDTFTYTVTDGAGASSTATVTMTVTGLNDAPVAVGDNGSVNENATTANLVATLLSNDTDVDVGDTRSITAVNTTGTLGTVEFNAGAQTLTYAANGAALDGLRAGVTANDTFTYTVTDGGGASSTATVTMTVTGVNDAPTLADSIADQTADVNAPFAFTVAADAFNDVDVGDSLSYSASHADDSLLPGWLSFDPATRTLSGTPANGDAGVLSIKIKVLDGGGLSASDVFNLSVNAAGNHAPTLDHAIADQTTDEDALFSFAVPGDTFSDVDVGDTLSYSVSLADGSELPGWLSFDGDTQTLSGTPANAEVGTISVKVTATDDGNLSVSDTFDLAVENENDAPTLDHAIADQSTDEDAPFTLVVPENTFSDVDVGDTLSYSASLASDEALPGWLNFDPATRTLSGTPANTDVGTLSIKVTATDGDDQAFDTFDLTVENVNDAPTMEIDVGNQNTLEDQAFTFTLPEGMFADVDAQDVLTLTARQADGSVLPTWLTFEGTTFTGTPGNVDVGTLSIKVTATDGEAQAFDTFDLTVENVNDAPSLNQALADQVATVGAPFAMALPDDAFADIDDHTLTYDARLVDGSVLPAWLTFDAQTLSFSGTPANADTVIYSIKVTATDSGDLSASDVFDLSVIGEPDGLNLIGTPNNDVLTGGPGNDTIDGRGASDRLLGNAGNDTLLYFGDAKWTGGFAALNVGSPGNPGTRKRAAIAGKNRSSDVFEGGPGMDVLMGSEADDALFLDDRFSAFPGGVRVPRIAGIERIAAAGGHDVIDLTSTDYAYGDVTLDGGDGNDVLWAANGDDVVLGALGNDDLFGGAGLDVLAGGAGNDTLNGDRGNDLIEGDEGNDTLADSFGNNLFHAGTGNDQLSGGSGNEIYIGGKDNDTVKTGQGADILAFNRGDGQDTVKASTGADNTLSIGGGVRYEDLTLTKSGNNLVLDTGNNDKLTLENWYAAGANHSVSNLQMITEAMSDFLAGGSDPLRDHKIERFDFQKIVQEFDQARSANPAIDRWAVMNTLLDAHLAGSDTEALGGDLAYRYGLGGSLAGISTGVAQSIIDSSQFGTSAQTLQPLTALNGGLVKLG